MTTPKSLVNWLRGRLQQIPRVGVLELHRLADGHKEPAELLLSIERPEPKEGAPSVDLEQTSQAYGDELHQAASDAAEALGGRVRFAIDAKTREAKLIARYPLAIGASKELSPSASDAEVFRHVTMRLMQHNERLMALIPGALEQSNGLVRTFGAHINEAEALRLEVARKREELASEELERELVRARMSAENKRGERMFDLLEKHVPEAIDQMKAHAGRSALKSLTGGGKVGAAMETLKRVWRVVDRRAIEAALDGERREALDGLLGLGKEEPKTLDEFKNALRWIIGGLGNDQAAGLVDFLMTKHPGLSMEFERLMRTEEDDKADAAEAAKKSEPVKEAAE